MRKIVVLAGSMEQYDWYLKNNVSNVDKKNYIYAARPDSVKGVLLESYVIVGTFWTRKDAHDIYKQVTMRVG